MSHTHGCGRRGNGARIPHSTTFHFLDDFIIAMIIIDSLLLFGIDSLKSSLLESLKGHSTFTQLSSHRFLAFVPSPQPIRLLPISISFPLGATPHSAPIRKERARKESVGKMFLEGFQEGQQSPGYGGRKGKNGKAITLSSSSSFLQQGRREGGGRRKERRKFWSNFLRLHL